VSRYRHVSAMKAQGFPVQAACEAAEVSTSAYYDWLERSKAPTQVEWDEAIVVNEMYEIHHHHDDTYGSPRMTDELRRRGYDVNHKRVERLQGENGIYAKDGRRKKVRTTIPDVTAPPLPDLVQRDFAPGEPAKRTCGDITYIPTGEGWLYMADVLDIGSRRIIGYALCDHMRSELVEQALDVAVATGAGTSPAWCSTTTAERSTWAETSGPCASSTRSPSPSAASARARTTPWPRASGRASSGSSSPATASPHEPRPDGRSSPGSTATTPCDCTRRSATSRRSSGNYATHTATCWPHNCVSG